MLKYSQYSLIASMRLAIRLYCEYLSIVLPYFLGGARRGTGELYVGNKLVELWFEGQVTLHGGSAEDLGAARGLADPHPDASVREEEHEEEPEHEQRRANPAPHRSRVAGHDQPGELAGALEGVGHSGDRRRLALVDDLGGDRSIRPVLVDLKLDLPRLDVGVRLSGGCHDDVDVQPIGLHVELTDAVLAVVGLPLKRRGVGVEGLACGVGDLHRRGRAEERLVERDAVPRQWVVDPYRLPVDRNAVLVHHKVARVVTWGAVRVVGVVERLRLDRQPGPVTDLNLRTHWSDELGVLEARRRAEEEAQQDDDEADVGHDGSEGTPAEAVGIQVQSVVVRVGDRPEAVGLQHLAYVVHGLVGFGWHEDGRTQGRMGEERVPHAGTGVERDLPQARRPVDRAGQDARGQQNHDRLEPDRREDGEEAEPVKDGRPPAVLGMYRGDPACVGGRVGGQPGRRLGQQGADQRQQSQSEDQHQPGAHRDEEAPEPVQDVRGGDGGAAVEIVEAVERLAVTGLGGAGADVLAHVNSLLRYRSWVGH